MWCLKDEEGEKRVQWLLCGHSEVEGDGLEKESGLCGWHLLVWRRHNHTKKEPKEVLQEEKGYSSSISYFFFIYD